MEKTQLKSLFNTGEIPTGDSFSKLIDRVYEKEQSTNGIDGKDGKDGKDGIDGRDGIDGINGKDFDPTLIPLKHWSCAVASTVQEITGTQVKVILGEVRGDVVFNDDRTIFTLKGGKTYRLTFYAAGTFNNATGSATFSFFNNDIGSNVGLTRSTLLPVSNATNQVHTGVLDFIFPITNTETNLSINCGVTTGSTVTLKNLQTYLIIQEL